MNGGCTGKLDALAKCTLLETLNLSGCNGYDSNFNEVSEGLTGTLDVLANCKNLKVLNCSSSDWSPMEITGTRAIANLKR